MQIGRKTRGFSYIYILNKEKEKEKPWFTL